MTDCNQLLCGIKIKECGVYSEGTGRDKQYYLRLVAIHKHDRGTDEILIPKIKLPVNNGYMEFHKEIDFGCQGSLPRETVYIRRGDSELELCTGMLHDGKTKGWYSVKQLSVNKKEMTIDEIEKTLGYKIKIVGEKKK